MKIRVQSSYDEKKCKAGSRTEVERKERGTQTWVPADTDTQIEENGSAGQARGADEGMTEQSKSPTPQKAFFEPDLFWRGP